MMASGTFPGFCSLEPVLQWTNSQTRVQPPELNASQNGLKSSASQQCHLKGEFEREIPGEHSSPFMALLRIAVITKGVSDEARPGAELRRLTLSFAQRGTSSGGDL
jgi:hypothetical protein